MIFKRILGIIILLTALSVLVISLVGAYFSVTLLDSLTARSTDSLGAAEGSLDAARDTVSLLRNMVTEVDNGLGTAVIATAGASQTLADSRPLIDNVGMVTTQEVPEAVEGIQAALPNMIEVAGVIDRTLVTLSSIGINRNIPLPFGGTIPLQFDLGIDYNPTAPFDETLRGFESSLDGLPESLRGLEDELQQTSANLDLLSSNLQTTSDDLATIDTRVGEILPLLDQYQTLVDDLSVSVARAKVEAARQLGIARLVLPVALILLALTQLAPLYLGWELLAGRRDPERYAPVVASPDSGEERA